MQYGELIKKLILPELKYLRTNLTAGLPNPMDYLLLGYLVNLQEMMIDERIKLNLAQQIHEFHMSQPPMVQPPVYSETGTSIFDEIRLTAPWITTQQPPKAVRGG